MKKILCFMLALFLSFNSITCYVYAEDFSGSSTDYNIPSKDTLKELPADAPQATENFLKNVYFQPMTEFFNGLGIDIWGDNKVWNEDTSKFILENASKDDNVTTDGNYYYISANFINNINQKVQDNIHALDGYYLFSPQGSFSTEELFKKYCSLIPMDNTEYNRNLYFNGFVYCKPSDCTFVFNKDSSNPEYIRYPCTDSYKPSRGDLLFIDSENNSSVIRILFETDSDLAVNSFMLTYFYKYKYELQWGWSSRVDFSYLKDWVIYGSPLKVFYSKQDAINYYNKGRQYYAPNLPFSNIRIPVTYINNTNELPDFNFDFDKLIGKTENEIQPKIDATLKAYLDHLVELNNSTTKPTPTVPAIRVTPTPDIGDRPTTPSPTPPVTDDTSDTNKLLEQIYDWLLDFGDKHETFVELITQYIENTDGKLDQIIEAIDKLSQGNTEGEVNGCKYDYTVLSEFMSKLWNDSDKKFDKMVDLLEENNYYQQRIIDALNDIIWTLKKETVLDAFKNRSRETADKAKEKFPTSLPWDIALAVNAFSAEPVEPVIEIPIKIESMHIDEKIVVDLSTDEWAKLAKTCRYLLSILFVLYMIHLSRKFFNKGDE